MKQATLALLIFLGILSLTLVDNVYSKIGVGVGTGKIEVEEKLKPGVIYDLPDLTVINTGDEASDYTVSIQHREYQEEEKPPEEWFNFNPSDFYLEPGESQVVDIDLSIPLNDAKPVKYFAFLSGSPTKKAEDGSTTIGVAAAAKLYFEVAPGNIFEAIYYRALSIYKKTLPWSNIALGTVMFLIVVGLVKRYINIDVGLKKEKRKKQDKKNEEESDEDEE